MHPLLKVEATKFTEVGYVGKDVDSIVRDLVEISVKNTRESEIEKVRFRGEDAAEERVLDALLPNSDENISSEEKISPLQDKHLEKIKARRIR